MYAVDNPREHQILRIILTNVSLGRETFVVFGQSTSFPTFAHTSTGFAFDSLLKQKNITNDGHDSHWPKTKQEQPQRKEAQ